ncbi:DUF202 domain-containing protein [Nocardioides pantholopis]|uniref:DUF202 domain-containing protein n=1 Tax=Nocardioides pantholopis TaxID=2483798 RepID=UPI000F082FC4|nr:DUF202 domain-containing protein [Nocardioides pantholopis]
MTGAPRPDGGPRRRTVPSDERTTLAWERTALTLLAVGVGTARHTWSELGAAALVLLVPIVLLTLWVLGEGWRRYDDDRASRVYRPIGGPTFVLAGTTALLAGLEAAHLLTR